MRGPSQSGGDSQVPPAALTTCEACSSSSVTSALGTRRSPSSVQRRWCCSRGPRDTLRALTMTAWLHTLSWGCPGTRAFWCCCTTGATARRAARYSVLAKLGVRAPGHGCSGPGQAVAAGHPSRPGRGLGMGGAVPAGATGPQPPPPPLRGRQACASGSPPYERARLQAQPRDHTGHRSRPAPWPAPPRAPPGSWVPPSRPLSRQAPGASPASPSLWPRRAQQGRRVPGPSLDLRQRPSPAGPLPAPRPANFSEQVTGVGRSPRCWPNAWGRVGLSHVQQAPRSGFWAPAGGLGDPSVCL